jgi:hypothetical protein
MIEKISLVFLWVSLAVFASSYNYMAWGVPFFTLFLAEHNGKLKGMVFYPAFALLYFLAFNGPFNSVGGITGPFYLAYPLIGKLVVVSRTFPLVAAAGPWVVAASLVVTLYYFASVAILGTIKRRGPDTLRELSKRDRTAPSGWKLVLVLALVGLMVLSWEVATTRARFPDHTYPLVSETNFKFADSFNSPLPDYQWAFAGEGTYQVNTTGGYIQLTAVGTYDRAYLYRGWEQVIDGFHASNATTVNFEFRFIGFAQTSTMIISRTNGGWFGAQIIGGATKFVYFDEVNETQHALARADNGWHNLTMSYAGSQRVIHLDNQTLKLDGVTFTRLVLGNPDYTTGLGGYAQFSDVRVTQNDFPSSARAWYAAPVALLTPLAVLAAIFSFGKRKQAPLHADNSSV